MFKAPAVSVLVLSLTIAIIVQMQLRAQAKELVRNSQVQSQIDELISSADKKNAWNRALDEFRRFPQHELVRQLLICSAEAKSTEKGMIPGIVFSQLKLNESIIPGALAEYLDTSNDLYRKEIEKWLTDAEAKDRDGPPNFKPYVAFLTSQLKNGQQLPPALISRMYIVDPGEALLSMSRLYEVEPGKQRALIWSEHVLRDVIWRKQNGFDERFMQVKDRAVAELETLVRHDAWWVRLYAAEIMRQHPELGVDEIVKRLQNDPNQLVKEAVRK